MVDCLIAKSALQQRRLFYFQTYRRWDGGPYKMPTIPPLPAARDTRSFPFTETGLDYLGPLYIKDESTEEKKVWVCLFTCLRLRAIHLELVFYIFFVMIIFSKRLQNKENTKTEYKKM